ncbi:molybdenum cofactor guanylyltransferase [Sphingopyxis sp. BSN-002]|uniref:molybdenum cofactor guanylyltransferase n=1 Tax=Sphingopyxis sp. BSN-002 TaxID=2911495 RepID=UPI001EDC7C22|nr:molybdenum cofactor guanylyltransferase [Sphingopyxis sp. BSN-002]UKK85231.1 molybdenum cofactor guanylyltransferase [Sphingopyxis sp. BSN-002]
MTDPTKRIAGVVLAGGRSSRFGSDKAEVLYRGRRLIDWSIAALEPHCEVLFVSGHAHPDHHGVSDRPEPGMGPLGGLAGAMQAAKAGGFTHLLSLPCDTPEVRPDLLERLCRSDDGAYIAGCPVIGLWRTSDGGALEDWLTEGRARSVQAWAEAQAYAALEAPPILNINRVGDIGA